MPAIDENSAGLPISKAKPEWVRPEMTVISVQHTLNSGITTTDTSTARKDS